MLRKLIIYLVPLLLLAVVVVAWSSIASYKVSLPPATLRKQLPFGGVSIGMREEQFMHLQHKHTAKAAQESPYQREEFKGWHKVSLNNAHFKFYTSESGGRELQRIELLLVKGEPNFDAVMNDLAKTYRQSNLQALLKKGVLFAPLGSSLMLVLQWHSYNEVISLSYATYDY
jgi:hypothetical protein